MSAPETKPLQITHLRKAFREVTALSDISLSLEAGQVLALLGPSGCGKTTLLRCIAGLLEPDDGAIYIGGQQTNGAGKHLPPEARHLGMVFQDYALWPHMSVAENVAFPLEMRNVAKADRGERVEWALQTVGLAAFADRSPDTLSGGQQQRVALARAIVGQPKLLLMDEPLSNLDKGLRESLAMDIRRLINDLNLAAVFVTHDQHEAFALADQIAVMQEGQLQQITSPQELYDAPANPGIARFLDAGTLLNGIADKDGIVLDDDQTRLPLVAENGYTGPVTLLLPRKALTLNHQPDYLSLDATLSSLIFQGEHYSLRAELSPEVEVFLHSRQPRAIGQPLTLYLDPNALMAWTGEQTPLAIKQFTSATARLRSVAHS
ncbi:ABC transporter ATP-binding protein [Salinispirillum sp. LH 10-3-1]|uniref:ABC transporter ATP-binding protein n=1 Tax=Salinispirillum sp. LH 10-3-1 TaxID=2952525 RepID=A0AB38YG40_9GAMM